MCMRCCSSVHVLSMHAHLMLGTLQDTMGQHDTHRLLPGVSETLQCSPVRKLLRMVVVGKSGAVEKAGNVIHLHFEGNWMPIKARHACSSCCTWFLPCTPPLSTQQISKCQKVWPVV